MKKKNMPGKTAHTVSFVLAVFLTVCLFAASMTGALAFVLNNRDVHEKVMLSDAVRLDQRTRIAAAAQQLADEYGFSADCLLGDVSDEALDQYNLDAISWWMGLVNGAKSLKAPEWPVTNMIEAVKNDESFAAEHKDMTQDAVINTQIVSKFTSKLRETVIPIRSNIVSFGMSKVLGVADITIYTAMIPYLPAILGLLSLCLAGIIFLLCAKSPLRGAAFVGSSFEACGLMFAAVFAVLKIIDLQKIVYSPVLSLHLQFLLKELTLPAVGIAAAFVVLGFVITLVHHVMVFKRASERG